MTPGLSQAGSYPQQSGHIDSGKSALLRSTSGLPVNLEKAGLGCWGEPSQHDWLGFFCGLVLVFDLNEGVIVELIDFTNSSVVSTNA
jgi:hypothetical protein